MVKKNYTKAGARRAALSCQGKLHKLWQDGHISTQAWIKLDDSVNRLAKKLK
jgi:hypothetical protein